jgi:hypothetical protein
MPKTDLTKISDADLQAEIERRAKQSAVSPFRAVAPRPLDSQDFVPLREMVIDGVAFAVLKGYWPKDFKQYVYEAAIEAVYGKAFWPWRNGINWEGE